MLQSYWSPNFRESPGDYSPHDMTQSLCKYLCTQSKFSYAGITSGMFCICGNDTSDFTLVDSASCNISCSGSSNEICGSYDDDLMYITEVDTIGSLENVTISVEDKIYVMGESIEIRILVQASSSWTMKVRFGDGTLHTVNNNDTSSHTVNKSYIIPGKYVIQALVQDLSSNNWVTSNEILLIVEDNITVYEINCPTVVFPESENNCSLMFLRGSFITMDFQFDEDINILSSYTIPDPYYTVLGQIVPVEANLVEYIDFSDKIIILANTEVKIASHVVGFQLYAEKTGSVSFYILKPMCDSGDYCEDKLYCDSSCNPGNIRKCSDDKVLCSYIVQCVDLNSPPNCNSNFTSDIKYDIAYESNIQVHKPGFSNIFLNDTLKFEIPRGYVFGFKPANGFLLSYRKPTIEEINYGIEDRIMNEDIYLEILHYMRPVLIETVNLYLPFSFNLTGMHSMSISVIDTFSEYSKQQNISVQIPISNVSLQVLLQNVLVGENITSILYSVGSNVEIYWTYYDSTEYQYKEEPFDKEGIQKSIPCKSGGNYFLGINVTNLWNSEYLSEEFNCFWSIGKNWSLSSNSPKSIPPGEILFDLKFLGSILPTPATYVVNFGDGYVENPADIESEFSDKWQKSFLHTYEEEGNFTVQVNISNILDWEVLEIKIQIFESFGNLSVEAFYVKSGSYPENKLELKGKNNTDAPINSVLYFVNNITGHVTLYKMQFEDESHTENSSDSVISYNFSQLGEYSISFIAWNSELDEYSNSIKLFIRILAEVSDFEFGVNTTHCKVDEIIDFTISLSKLDAYSCIIFNGGDDAQLLAFGNKYECTLYYERNSFDFVRNPAANSSRKRREASKAEWKDNSTISILYSYPFGGEFLTSVDIFNSVSRMKKNITVLVSGREYPNPAVWIDKNSTDIEKPIECMRKYDCLCETTAILRSNESYLASHLWKAYVIDTDRREEEVDISDLRTHNCSVLRILKSYLPIGLYKLTYTVTIYEESEEDIIKKSEDEDYNVSFENHTILGRRSTFTYLKIIPSPLTPMLIRGGASYVLRGFGQKVLLEPTIYSEDPDDPEDKNFEVTWFCIRIDLNESLVKIGKYDYDSSNPSKPIADRSTIKEEEYKGGCFGKGPGLMDIDSYDYELNTNGFWTWDAAYEIVGVIKKGKKVTEGHLLIKVIKDIPPSLEIMCEKKTACFPRPDGIYINSYSWVPLKVECLEDCGNENLNFKWELYAFNVDAMERTNIPNWEEHTIVDFDRMGINESLHISYPNVKSFLAEVTGEIPDTVSGMSSMILLLNNPPEGGKCEINATSGMALLDIFKIEFSGWVDRNNHKIKDYSIFVKFDETYYRLLYTDKKSTYVVLPYGNLEVWCAIEDELGAVFMHSIANFSTNLPTKEELEEYETRQMFDRSLAEGKMSMASQIVVARNSIIMEYRKQENKEQNFAGVSAKEVDTLWHEYWKLEGIDSSYYTPQAWEEIYDDLSEKLELEMDREVIIKNQEMSRLLRLPMESLPDAEIFGGALSALADIGPSNMKGKSKIMNGIENMYEVINNTDVAHPVELKVVLSQFGDLIDNLAGSLADSNIGENFLPSEMRQAEEELDNNATEPNNFIYYVEGNRKEVKERLHQRVVEEIKEDQFTNSKGMISEIKEMVSEIQQKCIEDLLVGSGPFYTESRRGFQLTFLKDYASILSSQTIQQGTSSIVLPDMCIALKAENCKENNLAVGIQAVRWTQPLESYGENSNNLSDHSNEIQLEITNREGNSVIPIQNTEDMFVICIPTSTSDHKDSNMEYVVPIFSSDSDILVYHTIFIDSPGIYATLDINPDNPSAPLIVVYKYGGHPSLQDYDGIAPIDGEFSLFIGEQIITESGKNLTVGIGQLANTTNSNNLFEDPEKYNLTVVNMTSHFTTNYSIKMSTTGCYYFSESEEKWITNGCKVIKVNSGIICCSCNHLTSFGSGFFVVPNEIDFNYVFAHAGFNDNIAIYVTIIIIISSFILLLIYARWKDRQDLLKIGATPLEDNEAGDKYVYEILVYTGHNRNAATKSNVFFIVSGDDEETEVRHFSDQKRPIFQKGAVDVFVMSVPRCLGQLNYLRLWHDNSGSGKWSSWYCQFIIFRDVQTGHKYEFIINRWFAVEYDDGLIDRLIPVAGKEQVTEFSHLFATNSRRNMADRHLWFSVFLRPPRSRFTRVQRVCCCMAVLCLSMLSNAMYYERVSAKPASGGFKLGPLSLSPEQIAVGIVSNLLIFPPTFIMIFFFRKSRPRKLRKSSIEEALKQQRRQWQKKNLEQTINVEKTENNYKSDAESLLYHRKRKFSLPWWCVYFGWLLVFTSIGASLFFMWAYGIEFGDEKTSKWLTSLLVSFISSIFVTQPIKILLMAIIMSCVCSSFAYDEDDADEDEEDPHLKKGEEYLHDVNGKRKHISYQPMDIKALEEARKEREKEIKMYSVLKEILMYVLFFWVIMIISYGSRDPSNFFLREALINGFIKPGDLWVDFNNVNTEKKFWNWTHNSLIPELFAGNWYNGRIPLGLRLYLDDRNNLKISYAVLRQVRIHPKSCTVSWIMKSVTPECAGFGSMISEDGTLYTTGWLKVNSTETLVPNEYKYLSASQLRGYPFWGQLDWYSGGGYVVPLVTRRRRESEVESLKLKLKKLEKEGWIDKHTRAVFVEFGVYNAQVNLFCALTIVAEFLPGGGVVPYYHIDPFRLLNYHTGFGLIQLAMEILFVIFTIFFTIKEVRIMYREGCDYFNQYWNIVELVSIVVSYTGIANHIYKIFATAEILRIFTETEGTGYVKLQELVLLDELFTYQIGLVMSISTLKFLKLLRFNKRIGLLSGTLRMCAMELQSYSVCLMVVFMAFVILFWLLLGRFIREFSTFVYSFESTISMMLKKFNYEAMYAAQPIFTPIAFFTFSLATSVILINILLSIIIHSFEIAKHDVDSQDNEYEILDFFINRLKMITGIGTAKVRPVPNIYRDKKKKTPDTISSFPDKVDRLVEFINDFYFAGQMDFSSKDILKKFNSNNIIEEELNKRKSRPTKALKSKIPKNMSRQFDF